ncbi:MAG: serine/threonine protein kinase [Acidobacteriaceae bacterium]|nr:serine/threonine protein kinase [Acidobacteriaceae bacterium]
MGPLENFGKYKVIRKLSRSMTDVYLALDSEANRTVVLKLIEHSRDDFTQLIMEAEARGAQLQRQLHASDERILEVYEWGETGGCFFVAMEYFEGRTLAEILKAEGALEGRRAARYAAEICSQLGTLHTFTPQLNGRPTAVVHGDIKPSNIQLNADDVLRLLDFGIAKVITSTHNLTHHNLGSPSYCSPERISTSQVDPHADLWAVGVSLYEMLAGTLPYQAPETRKLEALIQSRKPPGPLPDTCPPTLKAIVAKSLAPDMEERYQSAAEFESDLQCFLANRVTVAETEMQSKAKPTVERPHGAASVDVRKPILVPKVKLQHKKAWDDLTNITIALLAGMLAGLILFIPFSYFYRLSRLTQHFGANRDYAHEDLQTVENDWALYKELKQRNHFLRRFSPVNSLGEPLYQNLTTAAESILDGFRNSSDTRLSDFDWIKASRCLQHALELHPYDAKARSELALCNGYLKYQQYPKLPRAALSINYFQQAESYNPRSPDSHLALARVYIYAFHNVGQAAAELHQAERLGYKLGPREAEQQGDGYLFRAESSLSRARLTPPSASAERQRWLQLASDDFERAVKLYEPIAGFSKVNTNLEQLQQDRAEGAKLRLQPVRLAGTRTRFVQRPSFSHRWQ